jgi:hypothetical protein
VAGVFALFGEGAGFFVDPDAAVWEVVEGFLLYARSVGGDVGARKVISIDVFD